ncbi:MAG: hypothetical protein HY301_12815 [Verrucomicrobia bacterium]|nr:hypothetical protein [Verrucomicrobiota bacterium]
MRPSRASSNFRRVRLLRHRWVWIAALVAFGLGLVLLTAERRAAMVPIPHAYRVGTNVDWSRPELHGFVWLSTNEVLYLSNTNFFRLDLSTGLATPFPLPVLSPPATHPDEIFISGNLSPDRRYLLITFRAEGKRMATYLIDLQNSSARMLSDCTAGRSAWLPDSSGWIYPLADSKGNWQLEKYDLHGDCIQRAPLSNLPASSLFFPTKGGTIVSCVNLPGTNPGRMEIPQIDTATLKPLGTNLQIQLPRPFRMAWLYFSPRGDHLLIVSTHKLLIPHIQLQRDLPFVRFEDREHVAVWIGKLGANDWEQLYDGPDSPDGPHEPALVMSPWNSPWPHPDGRAISFRHGSNLWVRPFTLPGDSPK